MPCGCSPNDSTSWDIRVHYIALDDDNEQSFAANVHVAAHAGACHFCWQQPDEYRLDETLKALAGECEAKGMETCCADTEHFYTHRTELADFFKGKKTYRLENLPSDAGQAQCAHGCSWRAGRRAMEF